MSRSRGRKRGPRRLSCSPFGVCNLYFQLSLQVTGESRPAAVRLTLHVRCVYAAVSAPQARTSDLLGYPT
eukprot:3637873-Pleurochrysis_carterae.AAC.2